MSMPSFPENGINITKEQAFHMLLGSIAMEELALSHIMNAEGEKLQYVLGTLPEKEKPCTSTREVLEVNQSITTLMEHITQSQLLLKNKLAQVLQAMKDCPTSSTTSPCIPNNSHQLCVLVQNQECDLCQCDQFNWNLSYSCKSQHCWTDDDPSSLYLPPNQNYLLDYSFQVAFEESPCVSLVLQEKHDDCWQEITTCDSCTCACDSSVTLSGSTVVSTLCHDNKKTQLSFSLKKPSHVQILQAVWRISCIS